MKHLKELKLFYPIPTFKFPTRQKQRRILGPIEENHEVEDFVEPVFDIEVMSSVDASVDDDVNNNEVDSLSGDGLLK